MDELHVRISTGRELGKAACAVTLLLCACLVPTPGYQGPLELSNGTGATEATSLTGNVTLEGDGTISTSGISGTSAGTTSSTTSQATSVTSATSGGSEAEDSADTGEGSTSASESTGPGRTYVSIYQVASTGSDYLGSSNVHRGGEIVNAGASVIGKAIKKVDFFLRAEGSPTGPLDVVVRSGFDDSIALHLGTINAEDLTPGVEELVSFEASASYPLQVGDKVLGEWEGTGASQDRVYMGRTTYDTEEESHEGTALHQVHKYSDDSGYNNRRVSDMGGQWWMLE